jgi:uncharacterized protein with FMN-binding domain
LNVPGVTTGHMVMWAKLKKIVLSLSVIVLFALYALQKQAHPGGATSVAAAFLPTTTTVAVDRPTATSIAAFVQVTPTVSAFARAVATETPTATASSAPPTATASGAYRDGAYDGSQADAHWGTVEVQVVITNGQISDVHFVQYPNHRNRSQEINSQAMPLLTQEAIQSQQAQVDVVSGATDTSEAFIESLSAALSQAAS